MQIITIAGRLGNDAELRSSTKGDSFAAFSVAVSKGKDSPTTWFRCSLWGKRGESLSQYLTKGTSVAVVGEFQAREWEKDGKKGTSLEIRVSEIDLLGGGEKRESGGRSETRQAPRGTDWSNAGPDNFSDDSGIPF